MNYCPNCGSAITKDQDVCLGCGKVLYSEALKIEPFPRTIAIILALLFPIVGIVIAGVYRKTYPEWSKTIINYALISIAIHFFFGFFRTIFLFAFN